MFEGDIEGGEKKENEKTFKVIDKRKAAETGNNAENQAESNKPEVEAETEGEKKSDGDSESGIPKFEAGFSTFVYSLNTQALFFLGKIPNPVSKKYEKDIEMAKYLIDTIDMLSKKTKGNLDENETKLIENILFDLRMAYISEKK